MVKTIKHTGHQHTTVVVDLSYDIMGHHLLNLMIKEKGLGAFLLDLIVSGSLQQEIVRRFTYGQWETGYYTKKSSTQQNNIPDKSHDILRVGKEIPVLHFVRGMGDVPNF